MTFIETLPEDEAVRATAQMYATDQEAFGFSSVDSASTSSPG